LKREYKNLKDASLRFEKKLLKNKVIEISKMIGGLIKYLKK